MYQTLQPEPTIWKKISLNAYLITTISLLSHTISITYSTMTFKQQSGGFISIIVASLVSFFLSSSHLTIYGISILGILYLKILQPYYSRSQIHYIVALSGLSIFPIWKVIRYVGKIFDSFPGRVHASMVFGTALIALFKFFPLTIQNLESFFVSGNSNAITNPWGIIILTFKHFNFFTFLLTIICIIGLFLLRNKLNKFPFIAILVLFGVIINAGNYFKDYEDLCDYPDVDCNFYILKLENMVPPSIQRLVLMIPSAAVMTVILIFEQFLYLQEFERRGKRYFGEGDLGQTEKQSKTLALANLLSGCLGGLPICINMFATYQNFSFNIKEGRKGTKIVGLMQIPISYAFYSILKWLYQMIPMFILFVIVATPALYFLSNVLKIHNRHVLFISVLAGLNVITHPIIALILAAFISIHDVSLMLKSTPAEIVLQNVQQQGQRKSATIHQVSQKKSQQPQTISEFAQRVIQIQTDQPTNLKCQSYILYRFSGAVSYLNYFEHIQSINVLIQKYVSKNNIPLLLSFRYSQLIDEQSLKQLAIYVQKLENQQGIRVIFTGLHKNLIAQIQKIPFFVQMLRKDEKSMWRLDPPA